MVAGLLLQDWPDALHLCVLRHLGGPRKVEGLLWPYSTLCRGCAAAALLPPLWRHVDLSDGRAVHLGGPGLLHLLRRCSRGVTERLSIRGLEDVDDAVVHGLAELFAGGPLRALDLGGCPRVSGAALPALGSIPTLEELGAECVTTLEDGHLATLCHGCPGLARLDVRFCEGLRDVSVFLQRPDGWAALQLDGCFRIDVSQLLRAAPRGDWSGLRELSLDGEDLDASQLALVAAAFPGLQRLAVSFARELDAPVLQELAALPRLEALTLRKAAKPADGDWAAFFASQRRARTVAHGGIDAEATCQPSGGAQWRLLNMGECEQFSDVAALALAATPLPRLEEVDLSWCWHLSDAGLKALLAAAPGLRRIKLAGMKSLTASGLAPCCKMPALVELDCTSCNSVADGMLEFLHRLFAGPPGSGGGEALPGGPLPPHVASAAGCLWGQRRRAAERLQIKNYYAEYLQDWAQLRPPGEVCALAEALLEAAGGFG